MRKRFAVGAIGLALLVTAGAILLTDAPKEEIRRDPAPLQADIEEAIAQASKHPHPDPARDEILADAEQPKFLKVRLNNVIINIVPPPPPKEMPYSIQGDGQEKPALDMDR